MSAINFKQIGPTDPTPGLSSNHLLNTILYLLLILVRGTKFGVVYSYGVGHCFQKFGSDPLVGHKRFFFGLFRIMIPRSL